MTHVAEGTSPLFPIPEESLGYENDIDALHQARDVFFAACDQYHDKPNEERQHMLGEAAREYSRSFTMALRELAEEPSLTSQREVLMAGLFAAEDENVVEFFNRLTKVKLWQRSEQTIAVTERNITTLFELCDDNVDDVLVELAKSFAKSFGGDTATFVSFSESLAIQKRSNRLKTLRNTAVAIGGSALAITVSRWWTKQGRR